MKKFITILFSVILLAVSCAKVGPNGNISVTGVTLDQTTLTLKVGDKKTLVATVSPKNATNKDVIWSTSNKKVVTVDGGLVTAVAEGVAEITVTTDDGGKEAHCSVTVESSSKPTSIIVTGEYTDLAYTTVSVYGWCYQKEEEGLSAIYGIEYSDTDLTTAATTLKAESKGQDNKFFCKLSGLFSNTKYFYRAYVLFNGTITYGEVKTFTTAKLSCPAGAVDLNLSVCWATCNLGASKPEEYGGYYQWAGTKDVTDKSINLDWSSCPYHTGSSISTGWTKYIPSYRSSYWSGSGSPDNKTVLDPEDDVAHVKLGGKWRMPTNDEWRELLNNCTSEWTTLNRVTGRKFTSKKNGNSIFLPPAGVRYSGRLNDVGSYGRYGSSSLVTDYPYYAYYFYFSSDYVITNFYNRYCGLSVRPVSE